MCSDCANGKMKGLVKKMCFPSYSLFHQPACTVLCAFILCAFVSGAPVKSKSVLWYTQIVTRGHGRSSVRQTCHTMYLRHIRCAHTVVQVFRGLQLISNTVNTSHKHINTLGILDLDV